MAWSIAALPAPPGTRSRSTATRTASGDAPHAQHGADAPAPLRTTSFAGSGRAVLRAAAGSTHAVFSHLEFAFPLKLIHPRTSSHNADRQQLSTSTGTGTGTGTGKHAVAALYIVSYGGGLVSGDQVALDIDVGAHTTLLTLTQGSTKVFKMRRPPATIKQPTEWTSQYFRYLVRPHACLLVLPDPVTPYSAARYAQTQRFDLRDPDTSSAVVLDWFTPGRVHYAHAGGTGTELWDFSAYSSRNDFRVGGRVVARDALLLDNPASQAASLEADVVPNALAHAMHPFTVYGTLFLFAADGGPIERIVAALRTEFARIEQRRVRRATPPPSTATTAPFAGMPLSADEVLGQGRVVLGHVLWSLSELPFTVPPQPDAQVSPSPPRTYAFTVLRLAGTTTEAVRRWLELRLQPLQELVGSDLYKTALGGG